MQTNEIIGYRVMHLASESFVNVNFRESEGVMHHYLTQVEPLPIPRGDAFRRLAGYLDQNPQIQHDDLTVEPVYREYTPLETTCKELAGLLTSLTDRHGLKLQLTQEQIEKKIAAELQEFGAGLPEDVFKQLQAIRAR